MLSFLRNNQPGLVALLAPLLMGGLVLLTMSAPMGVQKAGADQLLLTCTAETGGGIWGLFLTAHSACTVPNGVTITRAVLEVHLDDGGEVYLNDSEIYSIANDFGVDFERRDVNTGLSAGQNFMLRVEARNAVDENGEGVGPVYGRATLELFGTTAPAPTHMECRQNACVRVDGAGSDTCSTNAHCQPAPTAPTADIKVNGSDGPVTVQRNTAATATWTSTNATSCTVSPTGWTGTSGSQTHTVPAAITLTLTCTGPGGTATDSVTVNVTDPPQPVSCTASPSTVNVGQNVTFTASGGTGSFSWSGGGSPATGSGANFTTQYSSAGSKTVTVTSGSQSGTCSVTVNPVTPQNAQLTILKEFQSGSTGNPADFTFAVGSQQVGHNQTITLAAGSYRVTENSRSGYELVGFRGACDGNGNVTLAAGQNATCIATNRQVVSQQLACTPNISNPNVSQTVVFTATGGTGSYSWSGPGTPGTGAGTTFSTQFGSAGTQTVTVMSGSAIASCSVNVAAQNISADIKANGQDGSVTVAQNSNVQITWTSQNATACTVSPTGWTGTTGAQSVTASQNQTYTVTCTGPGGTATDSVTVNVTQAPAPTVVLNANPNVINQGQSSVLTWTSQNATSCQAAGGWAGTKALSGSETVTPAQTTTYTIICTNASGQQATSQATVTVQNIQQGPTVSLTANPASIQQSQTSVLTWTSQNAVNCIASGGWSGGRGTSGSETVSPQVTTTYFITCTGTNGQQVQAQATVFVNTFQQITVNLHANPTSVNQGQPATLFWNSTNATNCFASGGWSGTKSANGSEIVYPNLTTTYTLTCTNGSSMASDSETIFVNQGSAMNLQVTKTALNRTLNQTSPSNTIEAQSLDILEFEIRVRNADTQSGTVNVRDILPQELFYTPNSTTVNGSPVADGITAGGISLGTLAPGEERTIRFRAVVFAGITNRLITNQVTATMNSGQQNAYATVNIRQRGQVLGAADIVTGPEDAIPAMLFLGLAGSLIAYLTVFKFRLVNLSSNSPEGPVSELQSIVLALRAEERRPDTDRFGS